MRNIIFLSAIVLSGLINPFIIASESKPGANAHDTATTVTSASDGLKILVEGNDEFVKSCTPDDFKNIISGQHPFLTIISCSDSRVHTNEFSFDPIDKVFAIRVIGNQFIVGEGSVDYGIHHLHTPILLVLGHTHCGAVKAAMSNYSAETNFIISELDHLHIPISLDDHKGDIETRWNKNVERNVDYQVRLAVNSYSDVVRSGKLTVIGAVYDFVNVYGKGKGRMVITNINDEKDVAVIRNHKVFEHISNDIKNVSVARVTSK